MAVLPSLALLLSMLFISTASRLGSNDVIVQRLVMPGVQVPMEDLYLCTAVKLDPAEGAFIVGFEPISTTTDQVHHAIVFGCRSPISDQHVWDCNNPDDSSGFGIPRVCASYEAQYLYGFDLNGTSTLKLPEGVGFQVGGVSGTHFLVLQVHYARALPVGTLDRSGITIHKTNRRLRRRAGVFMSWALGSLPAHAVLPMEAACPIGEQTTIHPFAYKVHTHHLGLLVSGYFVSRHLTSGIDQWTLLGSRNPQLPQDFIPIERTIPVNPGDRLASHCWMNNTHDSVMRAGMTHNHNEMCIFYLFYWVEDDAPLAKKICISAGPPDYSWATSNDFNNIPEQDVPAIGQGVGGSHGGRL